MARNRFDIRRSPVDGKFRRWEQRWASHVVTPDGAPAFDDAPDHHDDYKVWVVTGVFDTRKAVFS